MDIDLLINASRIKHQLLNSHNMKKINNKFDINTLVMQYIRNILYGYNIEECNPYLLQSCNSLISHIKFLIRNQNNSILYDPNITNDDYLIKYNC